MNREMLKAVIYDQHEIIRDAQIVDRRYEFDPNANYVVTGLRRSGKTTLLYRRALDLVAQGVDWNQIIYINFEDERLADFTLQDFNDIPFVQAELSAKRGFFFLDEVQNVKGWEKFARRMADAKERVYITGSNARMLSSEIESTLGGRYLTMHVNTYRFDEYLNAIGCPPTKQAFLSTKGQGRALSQFTNYLHDGGFPESLIYRVPRTYIESVYQKVLLGDIAARNGVREPQGLRILMKKVAETVRSEVSYTALHGACKTIGLSLSKDTVISYLSYAEEAYLLFTLRNFAARFSERHANPKWYFTDNGLLNLFLLDRDTALLENLVAIALHQRYKDELFFLKSARTGVDIDFFVPEEGLAVQVAYSIAGDARKREVGNLVKLASVSPEVKQLTIITMDERERIEEGGVLINVVPAYEYLLELAK